MRPLPLIVIGGYLGAGKTTLINRFLAESHGLRILVLVNDFGAINIDATLLISADEDTIELANGCVCCTMGSDLFMAVGDALDRQPRPDLLVIEASGVADPWRIANVANAEPDLAYAGIVTVVDGLNCATLLSDEQIGPQIAQQIASADILALSKATLTPAVTDTLYRTNPKALLTETPSLHLPEIILPERALTDAVTPPHAAYAKWSYVGQDSFDQASLTTLLHNRPKALYRVKGMVRGQEDCGYLVQVVGQKTEVSEIPQPDQTQLIGIGLASQITDSECADWWQKAV